MREGERREGEGCSFVAEQHPEDVDPENKSTVLRFHHGKSFQNALICIQLPKKERRRERVRHYGNLTFALFC